MTARLWKTFDLFIKKLADDANAKAMSVTEDVEEQKEIFFQHVEQENAKLQDLDGDILNESRFKALVKAKAATYFGKPSAKEALLKLDTNEAELLPRNNIKGKKRPKINKRAVSSDAPHTSEASREDVPSSVPLGEAEV